MKLRGNKILTQDSPPLSPLTPESTKLIQKFNLRTVLKNKTTKVLQIILEILKILGTRLLRISLLTLAVQREKEILALCLKVLIEVFDCVHY